MHSAAAAHISLVKRLARRLRGQRGFVLPATIGMATVLSIVGTTAVVYSTANQGASDRQKADQKAFAAAEAGVNDAMAILSNPVKNALDNHALCINVLDLPPCTRTSTYEDATVTWSGTLDPVTLSWSITSTGAVRNPTGPGTASVRRTLAVSVGVLASLTQPLNNQAWNYIYATKTGDPDHCDQELHNAVMVAAPLYTEGNLCLYNASSVSAASGPPNPPPAVNLVVKGTVNTYNSSWIGSSGARINQAIIANGCNGHTPCRWNGGGDPIWATTTGTTPPAITPPSADFDYWYQNASPGPKHPCTTVAGVPPVFENEVINPARNNSVPLAVDLTPALSYTCRTAEGELSWNATTKTLTVKGAIYIDGNVVVSSLAANNYNGQATLYLSGTFSLSNSAQLCGGVVAGACDFGSWNPNTEMLILAIAGTAGGVTDYGAELRNATRFQGGIWAAHAVHIANASSQEGPMIASNVDFDNSAQAKPFPLINTVPLGTPGNPNVYAQPQRPTYSG